MRRYFITILTAVIFAAANLPAQAPPVAANVDSGKIKTVGDSTALRSAPPDSLAAAKAAGSWARVKTLATGIVKWANDNEGFLALLALLGAILAAGRKQLLKFLQALGPAVSLKKRYLDHVIKAHQYLPVAGFETNLRVPIPLEKVYVMLRAQMTDIERARRISGTDLLVETTDRFVTVQEALKFALQREYKYDGLVILGNPGSGKTTLAQYFLLCFAGRKARRSLGLPAPLLPILLFLRDVNPEKSVAENILSPLQQHSLGITEEFFLSYLRNGKAILLLDGLDEVTPEAKRERLSQWIHREVHLAFPDCPVIVTSRFSGYRGGAVLPGAYLRLEIQDYELNEVRQFLENWLVAVETHIHEDNAAYWKTQALQKANDLFERIETTPALRELAVNPLMLQIIALVHRDRGTLPERRVELYKECTDVLLERWDKAKRLDVPLSAAQARQLLQPVALWMHSVENRREVSKQEILNYITPILPNIKRDVDAEALLQSWQERSGIFKGEGETFFFHHLSFQEYLTAEQIRETRAFELLVKNFDNAWWREPTLLAMGFANLKFFADFMAALLHAAPGNGAGVDFMKRCLDEALIKTEAPFAEALQRQENFAGRYRALLALEQIGTEQAKAAVRQVLHDKDEQVSGTARTILAKWGETPVEEKLETLKVTIKGKIQQMPARLFNPVEQNAEYILIPGAKEKIIFESTKKPAPDDPLYFAKYPVTNKLYNRFLSYLAGENKEALRALPREQFAQSLLKHAGKIEGFTDYLGRQNEWADKLRSRYADEKRFNGDDQPVVAVTWFAVTAYCHWLTELHKINPQTPAGATKNQSASYIFRLPREEEWEWAASGGKREYPWGNEEPDETRANFGEKVGHTTPVGAYAKGSTPEGLMDMAGNVWEWCENLYGESAYRSDARALRGGAYYNKDARALRCVSRYLFGPGYGYYDAGFRVVCCQS